MRVVDTDVMSHPHRMDLNHGTEKANTWRREDRIENRGPGMSGRREKASKRNGKDTGREVGAHTLQKAVTWQNAAELSISGR